MATIINSFFKELYLSMPESWLPETKVDNDSIFTRLREGFSGTEAEFKKIMRGLERSFQTCGAHVRYMEKEVNGKTAAYAAIPARECMQKNATGPDDIDLLIFASITRPYYEPAVANEVAHLLGMTRTHAFDITGACTTFLEAVYVGATFLAANAGMQNVLVCSSELPSPENMDFKIGSLSELRVKASALTLGCGGAAVLLSRRKPKSGFVLRCCNSFSIPKRWDLCVTPVKGYLQADSLGLFETAREHVPGAILDFFAAVQWDKDSVKQVIMHQPGNFYLKMVVEEAALREDQVLYAHQFFGNVGSVTVMLAFKHYLSGTRLVSGDKILLCAPGSGFAIVNAALEAL